MAAALSLSACAGSPKMTPHFLDTQLSEMREYRVVSREQATIQFKEAHKIIWGTSDGYGNGFFCIPAGEAKEWRDYYLRNNSKSQ